MMTANAIIITPLLRNRLNMPGVAKDDGEVMLMTTMASPFPMVVMSMMRTIVSTVHTVSMPR